MQDHQETIRDGCFHSGRATIIPVRSEGGQIVGYRDDRPHSHRLEIEMAAPHFLPGYVYCDDAAWWLDYTSNLWSDVYGERQEIFYFWLCRLNLPVVAMGVVRKNALCDTQNIQHFFRLALCHRIEHK